MTHPLPRIFGMCMMGILFFLAGCSSGTEDSGVVATVNGSPILLSQLEAKYDMSQLDGAGDPSPSVSRLRHEYGDILGDLIVQELIVQDLDKLGIGITELEVQDAEEEVRKDYPDQEAFEQVLIEEYIDLNFWRQQLRTKLAVERFFEEVLKPEVQLNVEEAKAYYNDHVNDFYLPPRIDFYVFRGQERDGVTKAVDDFTKDPDGERIKAAYPGLQVDRLKMREDRLPPTWHMALKELEPGQASMVFSDRSGFQVFVPIEYFPGKFLDPSTAYPLVERVLTERKMRDLFDQWLKESLENATIQVSAHLLEEYEEVKKQAQQEEGSN
ncbi:MAG: SurA N-terminal domain-containing protein [Desulfovibrionales bacterium]